VGAALWTDEQMEGCVFAGGCIGGVLGLSLIKGYAVIISVSRLLAAVHLGTIPQRDEFSELREASASIL